MVTIELMKDRQQYNIFISQLAYEKTRAYVDLCDKEIGWFGYVTKVKNGYLIDDVYLLKQKVHSATTEIDPQATTDYFLDLNEEGQAYYLEHHRLWGHSHVNMAPSPSGQDDTQGESLAKDVDYYIRLITNKEGKYHITIYDNENGIIVTTDTIKIYNPDSIALRKAIEEEIKEKVSTIVTTTSTSSPYARSSYYDYRDDYYKSYRSESTSNSSSVKYLPDVSKKSERVISKIELGDILKKNDYKCKELFA